MHFTKNHIPVCAVFRHNGFYKSHFQIKKKQFESKMSDIKIILVLSRNLSNFGTMSVYFSVFKHAFHRVNVHLGVLLHVSRRGKPQNFNSQCPHNSIYVGENREYLPTDHFAQGHYFVAGYHFVRIENIFLIYNHHWFKVSIRGRR